MPRDQAAGGATGSIPNTPAVSRSLDPLVAKTEYGTGSSWARERRARPMSPERTGRPWLARIARRRVSRLGAASHAGELAASDERPWRVCAGSWRTRLSSQAIESGHAACAGRLSGVLELWDGLRRASEPVASALWAVPMPRKSRAARPGQPNCHRRSACAADRQPARRRQLLRDRGPPKYWVG